ncbi:FAD-dependent oxidoreductase [Crenobacter sp. SG2305]|uniref:FAD-dependent oxidoreductase n=1 Tax=Crenobacter oryzisoli TaxID=3056844 RepID=UPI0025AB5173|nr:FAD-dependent oxidoreductase [Crenobacter sp. SG2305]MDN0081706.1 FAD-dependent oxidoreductase [Crenobacter sp. SG2305]
MKREIDCDVLVVGSGAAGLSAAVTARHAGLEVLVAEKAPVLGGTTAWSGGWLWIPGNAPARRAGVEDSAEAARAYLRDELADAYDAALVDAYLEHGPRMVDFFEAHTTVRFVPGVATPDFHPDSAGSAVGRPVCAAPIDGRELGRLIDLLRPPLQEITLGGMSIAAGADLKHFMNARRSLPSAWHVAKRLTRHAFDTLVHGRSMHLVNGNALAARLIKSADALGVVFRVASPVRELLRDVDGRIAGAVLMTPQGAQTVRARRGVVLACGGFPHDVERRRELFPLAPTGAEHWSAAPQENSGDGLRLAEAVGARVKADIPSPAAWIPVSRVPRPDGSHGVFPHLIDRAKPGVIAVLKNGRRFANESDSYHDVGRAWLAASAAAGLKTVEAFLLCDHRAIRRYGLGFAKPFPIPLGPYLKSGYLVSAPSIAALAERLGIEAAGLSATIERYNHDARRGEDPEFGRGKSAFNRVSGDATVAPNPCVAPVEHGPFYAVRLLPGSLGTFAGLPTDASARVLGEGRRPIPGLYAVGNDMHSVMGGHYPSGGITLGPAMTFGYLAGLHLAGTPPG